MNSATVRYRRRQIYAQLPTSADNVALPAFAVAHSAAVRRPCSSRSISPARRAHSSKPAAAACGGRQTDRQTPDSYIDPVRHTMQAAASQRRPLCMSHTSQRCRPVLTFFSLPRYGRLWAKIFGAVVFNKLTLCLYMQYCIITVMHNDKATLLYVHIYTELQNLQCFLSNGLPLE